MKVAILAGGLGTRLGDIARDVPKPMLEIAGRPFLEYVIESFAACELRDIVLLTGHRTEVVERHFDDGARFGVHIEYSREKELLGTGGAVREAWQLLGERFLLTYGDVLRRFDYDRFVSVHGLSCLAVYPYEPGMTTIDCGNVGLDDGFVTTFRKGAPELALPYVDAGFALIDATALELLPRSGACSFETSVYPVLAAQRQLESEVVDGQPFDIGNPADLARTRAALEGLS